MNPERLPEKKILPSYEDPEVTARKRKAMPQLLEGALDDVDPENRPTVLDFQGIRPDMTEDELISWVEKETGVSRDLLISDNSCETYDILNYAYQRGKDFLVRTLKYPVNQINRDPQSLSSKKDLLDLLNKTKQVEGQGLHMSVMYCRLVKTTLVALELLKHDAQLLGNITEDFENTLIASSVLGGTTNAPLISLGENNIEGNIFYAKENSEIKGTIETRAKKIESAMLKFITRPESSAKTALKDGIGSRITITEDNAEKLLPILYKWLTKDKGVSFVKIENEAYFSKAHVKNIKNRLNRLTKIFLPNTFSFSDSKANSTSGGDFCALKISGIIEVYDRENGELSGKPLSSHARQFEIQLVHPDNKNDKGKMNRNIYEVVKLVTARTRLDGSCPEDVFNEFVKDAEEKSGIDAKNIVRYLTKESGAPIVKKQKGKGFSYVSYSVYSRWNGFGWVDSSLFEEIDKAKK